MQIILGSTDKARNSTFVPPISISFECYLKLPTSVVRPVIQIRTEHPVQNFNYAYIPDFSRYYYFVEVTSLNAHMWEIQLEVDVLATYSLYIKETDAFVQYAESDFNTMIPDGRLPITDTCENKYYEFPFPPYSADGAYVLSFGSKDATGETGLAESIVLSSGGMAGVAKALFNASLLEEMKQAYENPLQMLTSAIWLPIGATFLTGGGGSFTLGDSSMSFSGEKAKKKYTSEFNVELQLPYRAQLPGGGYTYADYRNVEPYTTYQMTLPGVGEISIPMASWIEDGSSLPIVKVGFTLSPMTGDIIYELKCGQCVVLTAEGNISTPVPLASSYVNNAGALGNIMGTYGGIAMTAVGLASANPVMAVGGMLTAGHQAMSAVNNAQQQTNTVVGRMGGYAGAPYCEKLKITIRPNTISDSPSNIGKTIGRPLFAKRKLGSLSGFVKASGAYVKAPCTNEEHIMMSNYLEASANYTYGGVIIE